MIESAHSPTDADVIVVGGGLAGLACARLLRAEGIHVHVLESSDDVGGRVRTDRVDGFLLDRGFQVLLTAYEELQEQVDLAALDLRSFKSGSVIWNGDGLQTLSDPFRNPGDAFASLRADVGTLGDKLRVAAVRRSLVSQPPEACFEGQDRSTQEELQAMGFSDGFIDGFFRPFLGGVFLERALDTSAQLFRYYFRCFAAGDATVPAAGMQRLPELLAAPLDGHITLGFDVRAVSPTGVVGLGGAEIRARNVVVAVDGASAAGLLGGPVPTFKTTVTSYFVAPTAPIDEPVLILDGEGTGPANHVAVMSNVSPDYAPAGSHLVSVSGVDEAAADVELFEERVPRQLERWFGAEVGRWEHLRTYHIPRALPTHLPGTLATSPWSGVREGGVIVAGDYTQFGAIQGALLSGRHAAESVLERR